MESGAPGCFTGAGTSSAAIPIPAGAVVTGATAYVIDSVDPGGIGISLNLHDLTTGATSILWSGHTSGTPGTTTVQLPVTPGRPMLAAQALNARATISSGACFKGIDVQYIVGGRSIGPRTAPAGQAAPAAPDGSASSDR